VDLKEPADLLEVRMKGQRNFDKLSYVSDEQAWVRALDYAIHAESAVTFRKLLETWLPYFPDAAAAIDELVKGGYPAWMEFVRGFEAERDKRFGGDEWVKEYGSIILPTNAIKATLLANRMHTPWGTALVRIADVTT
jgi:hypothetical protein